VDNKPADKAVLHAVTSPCRIARWSAELDVKTQVVLNQRRRRRRTASVFAGRLGCEYLPGIG
jgi:hypothetical protein